jgi:hypothetical protein
MSTNKIQFMKIKKVHNNYIQLAHFDRKKIAYNFKNLTLGKKLYRKNNKIYIDVLFEKDSKFYIRLNKLKNYTIKTVFEAYKEKGAKMEDIEKNYVNKIKENNDECLFAIEVHPECEFIKQNEFDIKLEDTYKDLVEECCIDIVLSFKGIIFGKSNFTNSFVIHKIVRHYEEETRLDNCEISDESEEEDIENDFEKYSNKWKTRFADLYENEKPIKKPVEQKIETTEEIVESVLNNLIDTVTV